MDRASRWTLAAAVSVALLGGGWAISHALGPELVAVHPVRQPLTETLLLNGRTTWPDRAELGAMAQGTVAVVSASEGDDVAAGAVLVQLADQVPTARLHEAEAQVAEARARLSRLRGVGRPAALQQLEQARLAAAEASRDFDRQTVLFEAGGVAQAGLEAARNRRDRTASQLVAAELEVAATDAGGADTAAAAAALARAQAGLDAARAAVEETRVRAPTAGRVLERRVEPGQVVRPGDVLVVFSGDEAMQIEVTPDEVHLGRLAPGLAAAVRVEAFPDVPLSASVDQLAPQVDAGRGTVRVRLALTEPAPDWLRPDMTVTAEIVLGQHDDALLLPVSHVQGLGTRAPAVLVVEGGTVARVPVRVGAQDAETVEVLEGLDTSATVLPAAVEVQPGDRVRIGRVGPALPPTGG